MKYSIEKVIDAMELRQEKEDWDVRHDAIEYLKDYKAKEDHYAEAIKRTEDYRLMYIHAMANEEDNPELTWEQLEKMEGKPVWIEGPFITEGPHWIIVGPSHLYDGKIVGYGKTWQAYRKERV